METRLAKILSYLFHPLLIPTYATLLLLNLPLFLSNSLSMEARTWLLILVSGFTFVIPVVIITTLYYFRLISSIELDQPKERTMPLLFSAMSYYALLYMLRQSGLPAYFLYFIYGALLALLTGLMINLVYKISLHTLGWGAAVASLVGLSVKMGVDIPLIIIAAILISGITGYIRLKINAHNPTQVYLGFVTGVCIITLLTLFV
jgi:hypothetical protein